MNRRAAFWLGLIVLNVALASLLWALAPPQVGTTSDRLGYEYVAQHGLQPDCPHSIFCYRVLLPTLLSHVPTDEVTAWRGFTVVANSATGVMLGSVAALSGGGPLAAVLASILFQTSFGATFTLFDPFTPDAAVALCAAGLLLCWHFDKPRIALLVAVIGVFAKETVALLVTALAVAGRSHAWLAVAVMPWLVLLGFHGVMNLAARWTEQGSASANLLGGAWLGLWLRDPTLTPATRVLYVFIPFGFAWLFAIFGIFHAPPRLRWLAVSSIVLLPLVYVQTPERALATFSFVVVPLAALYLGRAPMALALLAALANGLLTARVGLSTTLLPPLGYLLILAGTLAALTIGRVSGGISLSFRRAPLPSSRTTSLR